VSQLEPNTVVPIVSVSPRTLREKKCFPDDVLDRLERTLGSEKAFVPQAALEELLSGDLEALLPEILKDAEAQRALVHPIPEYSDDFTFYLPRRQATADGEPADVIETLLGKKIGTHSDGELWLWYNGKTVSGRVSVCSCSKGAEWSVTFRRQQEFPRREGQGRFFNTFDQIAELLESIIFGGHGSEEHGLVVITGRTGSGKSQIARKLIAACLSKRPGPRVPHLVTFEDPIEKDFRQAGISDVDSTQREKARDADNLTEVLQNALRQTPRVLFVGETRRPRDWKQLLEFAGTGHLVMTTAHAGSLVEAVGNILQETDSRTPATRSIVADRLLAVVHVLTATQDDTLFLIPAIWHRTPLGVKALMAEGLSSLLPNTPREHGKVSRAHLPGSVGRYWFARELAKKSKYAGLGEIVKRTALEWDLEGL
jgi:hypothetical protein